jgi:hypothetical protein
MIITTKLTPKSFDAVTCWPFIFMRPECADDKSLVLHEMVHYNEQRAAWVVPWLLRYAFSKQFRFDAEVRGYKAQVADGGISLAEATHMLTQYAASVTYAQARAALIA